jgi:tRNA U34 5-carboxymethylaminomethyl modifying GTPase MnmE/TrmE
MHAVASNSNSLSDGAQILIALLWRSMQVLLLSMLAPKSYTSEDVIELHCHGGVVCVQRVLGCCLREGARLAKPGEFTLRAFLNGRLDLSQVSLA